MTVFEVFPAVKYPVILSPAENAVGVVSICTADVVPKLIEYAVFAIAEVEPLRHNLILFVPPDADAE